MISTMENESNENKLSIFNNGSFGTVRAMPARTGQKDRDRKAKKH